MQKGLFTWILLLLVVSSTAFIGLALTEEQKNSALTKNTIRAMSRVYYASSTASKVFNDIDCYARKEALEAAHPPLKYVELMVERLPKNGLIITTELSEGPLEVHFVDWDDFNVVKAIENNNKFDPTKPFGLAPDTNSFGLNGTITYDDGTISLKKNFTVLKVLNCV